MSSLTELAVTAMTGIRQVRRASDKRHEIGVDLF